MELVTKTRTEHLTEADKIRHKTSRSPLQSLLGIVEVEEKATSPVVNGVSHLKAIGITANWYGLSDVHTMYGILIKV